jgi:predicted nucleotidyltransferase
MSTSIREILNELRRRLETLYGDRLVKVILYGSHARGDAESESDIDVLVVLKGVVSAWLEIERTGKDVAELSLEHDVVISCLFMAEERYLTRNSPLLLNVRREGVPV